MSILSDNISVQPTIGDILADIRSDLQIRPHQWSSMDRGSVQLFIDDSMKIDECLKEGIKISSSLVKIDGNFMKKLLLMTLNIYLKNILVPQNIRVRRIYNMHYVGEALKYDFQIDIVNKHAQLITPTYFTIPPKYYKKGSEVIFRFIHRGVECWIPCFHIILVTTAQAPHKMKF